MTWLHNTNSYRLKTATGEAARVYGEVRLTIRMAELEFSHVFLVADICDECIIGIDFMKEHGIILDIGNQVLKYRNVEIPMVYGTDNSTTIRTVIKEDMCLPPSSEVFVWTKLKGNFGSHRYLMVEPEVEQSSENIIIGKTLVAPKNNMVPVRILNIKPYPIKLKKGEVVGQCESVSAITKINDMDTQMTMNSEKLKTQILKSDNLSQHQLNVAGRLLHEYADIFSSPSGQYGRTQLVQHRIDTGDARPIRQPARRLPLAKQGEVEEMISTMKKDGLIENSKSPWASPVVLVKKKDGSTRFCVDYRRLNDVTKKDSYPLPRISDTLDAMEGAQWFSTLDLKSGYWQVEIHPEDREKIEEILDNIISSPEDEICEKLFAETTTRNADGRYICKLPFKDEVPALGVSREQTLKQYLSTENALAKNPSFHTEYNNVLEEYLTLNHMKKVAPIEIQKSTDINSYYLPQHAVIKPESTTTKTRIVFNASSPTSNGKSLNDILYTGPSLQSDLISLILNWRFYRYVFNADITKMYRQIFVHPEHTPFQRILFRNSRNEPVSDFELQTVTFGINCAPFLAIRTLKQLADDIQTQFPLASNIIRNEFYVDDALSGAHDIGTAKLCQQELVAALNSAGFTLRKWTSNCSELLDSFPSADLLSLEFLKLEEKSSAKMLGI
ncbi:uncharacterized protein LOC129918155 [Episyrphus balteatus]|uniref:uncharacterized protein LOC129918155 n=1 Tax=Episyrphus balteatus TaxID=286459 RepID=UPI002486AB7F|nr:uncharacterized protein LOC129918155 [Episyrphus balteatus]